MTISCARQCVVGDILKSCHIRSLRAPLKMPLSHHTEQGHRQGSDDGHAALFDGHEFKSWSIFCENHIVANTFTPWTLLFFEGNCPSAVLVHADYCIYLKRWQRGQHAGNGHWTRDIFWCGEVPKLLHIHRWRWWIDSARLWFVMDAAESRQRGRGKPQFLWSIVNFVKCKDTNQNAAYFCTFPNIRFRQMPTVLLRHTGMCRLHPFHPGD